MNKIKTNIKIDDSKQTNQIRNDNYYQGFI